MSDIELTQVEPRPFLGVRRTVHHTKMQEYFSEVLPLMFHWLNEHGIAPASAPMAVWHGMDRETGMCDAQAGFFTAGPVEGEGEVTAGTTAGGDVLKLVHVGPYDKMGQSWGRVFQRAGELGRAPGAGWEIYIDDPGEVAPDKLRTEIYLPIS